VRKVWIWLEVVSVVGIFASAMMDAFNDDYKAYGEVPIPGTRTLHLPAGDVVVSFHANMAGLNHDASPPMPIPQNLELVITAPSGAAQPSVTEKLGGTNAGDNEAHRQVKVAHIPVAGDYTITTNGGVSPSVSPRLSFGHDNYFEFLMWLCVGLFLVSLMAFGMTSMRQLRTAPDAEPKPISGPELLASGQRVRGVLKSFRATGHTMRSRGRTPSRPEFLDYPYYALVVELLLPNMAPVIGRNRQPIPPTEVPNLTIGRELNCAVDPVDPANRFAVDWTAD
jgi:hypothetical protein